MNSDTLDALERRDPAERERALMARLPELVALAQTAPGWARILDGVDAAGGTSASIHAGFAFSLGTRRRPVATRP